MTRAATTHTEIYRRFEGELRPFALRCVPLFLSQVRVLQKKKLPLLLLYAGPAIASIVFSFIVYGKFTFEEQLQDGLSGPVDPKTAIAVTLATKAAQTLLEVRNQIVEFNIQIQAFALLAIAWFGAGLIAEDRKLGAHLLYFSRPLTKLDYFAGHFMTVSYFGLLAVLAPALVICLVATFTSPDYSFLKEDWDVPLESVAYALISVTMLSSLTLAVSSLCRRKSFALVIIVGLVSFSEAAGGVLSDLNDEEEFMLVGLWNNLMRLGDWVFGTKASLLDLATSQVKHFTWDPLYSVGIVSAVTALSLAVCWLRLRSLEGVG